MDGDSDFKRPRDQANYSPSASRPPNTTNPAANHPDSHPSAAAPLHPFQQAHLPVAQHQHHPPVPPGAGQYRETLPDPRALAQYQQPSAAHQSPDPRTGYGPPVNAQHVRSYSVDKGSSPRNSVSGHSQVTDPHRASVPPPATQEAHMEHGVHPSGYLPHPMDPYVNGGAANGLPYHPSQEPYPTAAPPHSYPPTPVGAYPQPTTYPQGPSSYGLTRRKQVRAQQACNNCRQRKQKCDEARPCGYCKQEQLDCEYKEVPPPKTDRTMALLIDQQKAVMDRVDKSESAMRNLLNSMFQQLSKQIAGRDGSSSPTNVATGVTQPGLDTERPLSGEAPGLHTSSPLAPHDYDDVFVARPEEHHTGAHHLMNKWTAIKDFFNHAGITNEEYVHDEEEKRSLLDPYEWCAQPFDVDAMQDVSTGRSPSSSGYQGDFGTAGSPNTYGQWAPKYPSTTAKPETTNPGGLRPDGKLQLDEATIRRLHESYLKHMWILHPFIDARELKRMVDRFVTLSATVSISPWMYPGAPEHQEAYSGIGIKRKRHNMSGEDHSTPSSPGSSLPGPSKRDGTRVIETAIVLLVLALGKILEHTNYLLTDENAAVRSKSTPNAMFAVPQQTPGQNFVKPSPPNSSAFAPVTAGSSPGVDRPSSAADSRGSPGDRFLPNERRERDRRAMYRNLDVIPGLAYFAPASLILGNQHAGNDIPHAQAYLLAGLYMGQLGRVLDSWNYIYTASRTVVVLLRTKHYDNLKLRDDALKNEPPQPLMDDISTTVSTLYWSTLQLESDIRAELDKLPPSLIWGYEDSLRLPDRLLGAVGSQSMEYLELQNEKLSVRDVMFHYHAQISIRRTLNRAHAALYSVEDRSKKAPRGTYKVSWADADAPQLWESLQFWRRILPAHLQWHDDEDLAIDINTARLRGKYYGAAYMITRPYLHAALYQMKTDDLRRVDWAKQAQGSPGTAPHTGEIATLPTLYTYQENVDHIIWACKQCIDAAIKSTTAFDGLSPSNDPITRRPRVTNIHGTAAAQFSNILVLAAAYKNPFLRQLVPEDKFWALMQRTIVLLSRLSPLSPVFGINQRVLETTKAEMDLVRKQDYEEIQSYHGTPVAGAGRGGSIPLSASSSFSGR